MLQNVEFSNKPDAVSIQRADGIATVTFAVNIQQVDSGENGEDRFTADLYTIQLDDVGNVEARVNAESFLSALMQRDREETAAQVRAARNTLLAASDAQVAIDRYSFDLPEHVTAGTMLTAFVGLIDALRNLTSGSWAQYRQALRDLPTQPGFPYQIEWPVKPDEHHE